MLADNSAAPLQLLEQLQVLAAPLLGRSASQHAAAFAARSPAPTLEDYAEEVARLREAGGAVALVCADVVHTGAWSVHVGGGGWGGDCLPPMVQGMMAGVGSARSTLCM